MSKHTVWIFAFALLTTVGAQQPTPTDNPSDIATSSLLVTIATDGPDVPRRLVEEYFAACDAPPATTTDLVFRYSDSSQSAEASRLEARAQQLRACAAARRRLREAAALPEEVWP